MPTVKNSRHKKSPGNRKGSYKSQPVESRLRKREVSGNHGGSNTDLLPTRINSAPLLNPGFGAISPFKTSLQHMFPRDADHDFVDLGSGLAQLYSCMKKVPGFKDSKDWKRVPEPAELADYLFPKLRLLKGKGREWAFVRDRNTAEISLVFYKALDHLNSNHILPLEWLPWLEKRNPFLKEVVLDVVGAVAKAWKLDVIESHWNAAIIEDWEGHLNYGDSLDETVDGMDPTDAVLKMDVAHYFGNGAATKYKKRLSGRQLSIVEIKKKLSSGYAKTRIERFICRWLRDGIAALEDAGNIHDYHTPALMDYDPDDGGPPVVPSDLYSIAWSIEDSIYDYAESSLTNTEGNIGMASIISKTEYYTKGAPYTVNESPIKKLANFFFWGKHIYHSYYRKRVVAVRQNQIKKIEQDLITNKNLNKKLLINKKL